MNICAFRLDDITPDMHWENFEALKQIFDKYNVKPLLGVVPDNQDSKLVVSSERADFWDYMHKLSKAGYSIAQHGYQHVYETKNTGILGLRENSEFAGLPYEIQAEKIRKGRELLKKHSLETDIFMAPSHTYDTHTLRALKENGFFYVTDGYAYKCYMHEGLLFVPSRSPKVGTIKGIDTICLHLNNLTQKHFDEIEIFIKKNREHIVNFSDLLENEAYRQKFIIAKICEKKNLKLRLWKDNINNNQVIKQYLAHTYTKNKWSRLIKRVLLLPKLGFYLCKRGK